MEDRRSMLRRYKGQNFGVTLSGSRVKQSNTIFVDSS
jgi:hypothetical protein